MGSVFDIGLKSRSGQTIENVQCSFHFYECFHKACVHFFGTQPVIRGGILGQFVGGKTGGSENSVSWISTLAVSPATVEEVQEKEQRPTIKIPCGIQVYIQEHTLILKGEEFLRDQYGNAK
jgi:hypothetical protein